MAKHPLDSFLQKIGAAQSDLSRESGVSQPMISQVLNFKRRPSPELALLLEKGARKLAGAYIRSRKGERRIRELLLTTAADLLFLRAG
jgi:transcriptional regulator with XRE-family HTH domain